jgi:hypothetical protein
MHHGEPVRLQFSLRTLLLITAAVAVLLVPFAWVARERQEAMRARDAMLHAREVALRSVVVEGERRRREAMLLHESRVSEGSPSRERSSQTTQGSVEQLQRVNADLRQEIAQLRRQVEQLTNQNSPAGAARP